MIEIIGLENVTELHQIEFLHDLNRMKIRF
jgi:hypothetical protein